jgi:uncharacterized BrkB/YihY/UPF0761 family membrane protein
MTILKTVICLYLFFLFVVWLLILGAEINRDGD